MVTKESLFASSPPTRKEKKNKYAKFSKVETSESAIDPLEALIRESEEKLFKLQLEREAAKKGHQQNIPITPDADKRLNFPNNKDIDPYDPTTFGFVEIGTEIGRAHV